MGDPSNKKKGFYKLTVDSARGFAFGFFGDYRGDIFHAWHSKSKRKYSPKEMEEFRRIAEEDRKKEEERTQKRHQQRARDAKESILFLDKSDSTNPYLKRKGVKAYGLYQEGDNLIIPLEDKSGVVNTQTIYPNGEKRFIEGAKKQGAWFKIDGQGDTIYIAEGYATAASVFEATGGTTYMAIDAGNMPCVAADIRAMHPDSDIIIASDNDYHDDPEKINAGIAKGTQAARLIGAKIIWPEHEEGVTDFNDLHAKHGIQYVQDRLRLEAFPLDENEGGASTSIRPFAHTKDDVPPSTQLDDWQSCLATNKDGEPLKRSTKNLLLIAEHDPELRGVFKYDDFSKQILVVRCPPWEDECQFMVRRLQDTDYIALEAYLEEWNMQSGKVKCADLIERTARLPQNIFNPATDYFESLEWDGVPRLEFWLQKYVSNGTQNSEYLKMIGKKFLCGMAARAMQPGVKFDHMIILEGRQYAGKSFLARLLATINGEEYFLDDFKDIENKDALLKMQGKLIVEFPEISTLRKTEINDLKAFITRQTDEFRPPYGRQVLVAPRQCVFIGTVNPEGPYLRDVTGNRRYWPVACRDKLDLDNLKGIIPQLHAEAAYAVKGGEDGLLTLSEQEYDLCVQEQSDRLVDDPWIDKVEEVVSGVDVIGSSEIMKSIGLDLDKRSQMHHNRIQSVMTRLGYESGRFYIGGKRIRGFRKVGVAVQRYLEVEVDFDG